MFQLAKPIWYKSLSCCVGNGTEVSDQHVAQAMGPQTFIELMSQLIKGTGYTCIAGTQGQSQ
jgi:hypothetical protein